jgi:hypothetical protein
MHKQSNTINTTNCTFHPTMSLSAAAAAAAVLLTKPKQAD